jgi:hypothetical protein
MSCLVGLRSAPTSFVASKYLLGAGVGIPAASLCIIRRLYKITAVQTVSVTRRDVSQSQRPHSATHAITRKKWRWSAICASLSASQSWSWHSVRLLIPSTRCSESRCKLQITWCKATDTIFLSRLGVSQAYIIRSSLFCWCSCGLRFWDASHSFIPVST